MNLAACCSTSATAGLECSDEQRERRTSAALQKRKDRKIAELRIDLKRRDGNIAGTIDKFVTVCRENVQEKGGTPTLQSVTAMLKDSDLLVEMCAAIGRLGWKGATAETAPTFWQPR